MCGSSTSAAIKSRFLLPLQRKHVRAACLCSPAAALCALIRRHLLSFWVLVCCAVQCRRDSLDVVDTPLIFPPMYFIFEPRPLYFYINLGVRLSASAQEEQLEKCTEAPLPKQHLFGDVTWLITGCEEKCIISYLAQGS